MRKWCVLLCLALIPGSVSHAQLPYEFTQTARINDGGYAWGLAMAPDGTIFLANSDDGLRAYSYDGTAFANTAHIDSGG